MTLTRITVNPSQMGGMRCIRGLRIPLATVVDMVADGMSEAEILQAYPELTLPTSKRRCRSRLKRSGSASCHSPIGEVPHRQCSLA